MIEYALRGTGPGLLLISGLAAGQWFWKPQAAELAQRFTVITYESRRRPVPRRTEEMAGDAVSVLDAVGVEQAYVAGVSMGGFVAQQLALDWPGRVRGLVLAATAARCPMPDLQRGLRLMGDVVRGRPATGMFAEAFRRSCPDEVRHWNELSRRHSPAAGVMLAQIWACLRHDVRRRLGEIEVPALVVHGTADRSIPVRYGRELARLTGGAGRGPAQCYAPNVEYLEFEGVGHGLTIERAAEFNAAVARLMARGEGAGSLIRVQS